MPYCAVLWQGRRSRMLCYMRHVRQGRGKPLVRRKHTIMCIYIYIYIHIHIYTHSHIQYVYIYIYIHIYIHICVYVGETRFRPCRKMPRGRGCRTSRPFPTSLHMLYIYMCMCIYIYRERDIHTYCCIYIYIYVYIHTYIEGKRDRIICPHFPTRSSSTFCPQHYAVACCVGLSCNQTRA